MIENSEVRKPEDIDTFQIENEIWHVKNPTDRVLSFQSNYSISKQVIKFVPGEVKAFPLGMARWLANRIAMDIIIHDNNKRISKMEDKSKSDPLEGTADKGRIYELLPTILIGKVGGEVEQEDEFSKMTYQQLQKEAIKKGLNPVQKKEELISQLRDSN